MVCLEPPQKEKDQKEQKANPKVEDDSMLGMPKKICELNDSIAISSQMKDFAFSGRYKITVNLARDTLKPGYGLFGPLAFTQSNKNDKETDEDNDDEYSFALTYFVISESTKSHNL